MKKYIFAFVGVFLLISACIYLVFSRDETLTITYIKFKVNPEFVIGINNDNKVILYNPLNEDAKIFNLGMFNNKSLEEFSTLFIDKMEENNYLSDNIIDMIVMTKNKNKKNIIVETITNSISEQNNEIIINVKDPTFDEMLAYSNETVYDLEPTYNEEDLKVISNDILNKISNHINNKINNLKVDKIDNQDKKDILEQKNINGYFDDFNFSNVDLGEYSIDILDDSNYEVEFTFDENLNYQYNIIINIVLESYKDKIKNDVKETTVEVYKYTYNLNSEKIINNYKNEFYIFTN